MRSSPIGGLALAELRGVLIEREVGRGAVIVLEVLPQDAPQVLLSHDDDVVKASAARRECEALPKSGSLLPFDG